MNDTTPQIVGEKKGIECSREQADLLGQFGFVGQYQDGKLYINFFLLPAIEDFLASLIKNYK